MKITISKMISLLAALFVILSALPIYFSYLNLTAKVRTQGENDFKKHVLSTAQDISSFIRYFQLHTDELANNPEIKSLANFWKEDDIQEWTIKTRKILPQTVGLAIFDHNGEIIGDADAQKMGEGCLLDVNKFIHSQPVSLPPVHKKMHQYRHFDLYSLVKSENGEIYLLVHTMHLEFIERLLQRHDLNNEHYLIVNDSGGSILEQGKINQGFSFEAPVPGTDWLLKGTSVLNDALSIKQFANTVLIQVFVIIITITLLISYVVFRLLQHDKKALKYLMSNMGDKKGMADMEQPFLHDFNELAAVIEEKNNRLNQAIADIEKMALEDNLTQTGNRRLFEKEKAMHLSHCIRGMSICAVALDLDNFKMVNDKYGHAVGDQILFTFGKALNSRLRDSDAVYRFGGDEFVVILYSINSDDVNHWYDRVKTQFYNECAESGIKLDVGFGISAGASELRPSDASLYETMLRADKALYESKQKGRGQMTVAK